MLDGVHAAAAMEILAPAGASLVWTSVCCWCLAEADPEERHVARRCGGDCVRCLYTGRDTFVALLPSI